MGFANSDAPELKSPGSLGSRCVACKLPMQYGHTGPLYREVHGSKYTQAVLVALLKPLYCML